MANQKQHHYVPRFYLDRFADPIGHVWAYDKSTDLVFCGRPETLGRERGFYEAPFLQGTAVDPEFLERELARLESEAARITSSWIRLIEPGGRIVTISEIDRRTIATYIAVQALRTSEQRVALGQHTDIRMSKRDLQSFHLGILFEDSVVQKIAGAIGDCIWIFGRNSSSVPFYTSDHPVAARVHPGHRCIHPFQLPTEGAEIMLPLSATLMFYSYERSHFRSLEKFDGHVSPVRFTTELVESDNQCQVGHSRRFVFCERNDFGFARKFCDEHPVVRDPKRRRFV